MSEKFDCDVIVIGSGFGGASAAESLAGAGLKVAIVERGTWWGAFGGHKPLPETLPQIVSALEGLNVSAFGRSLRIPFSRRGLLETHFHGGTVMLNAVAVGGNSLVSGAMLQRPAPQFFDMLPPELTAGELEPHYLRMERALEVAPGPCDERGKEVLRTLADRQRWTLEPSPQAIRWRSDDATRPACIRCNRCMVGCNVGAKVSLDQTLVPQAIAAGAVLHDLCSVQTIESVAGGYAVRFDGGRRRRAGVLRAPRVIVAAGTLNTLKILHRSSAAGGLGVMPGLGRHFSLGGDTLEFYRVPVDVASEPVDGHCVDTLIGVPDGKGERDFLFAALHAPLLPKSALLRRIQGRRTLALFGFGPDEADGEARWGGGGICVRHKPQAVIGRIQTSMDIMARGYGWNKRQRGSTRSVRPWFSIHPLGGCRMATDASQGVVDFKGEVFGHPGLYVADASIFPNSPAAGPQLSVAALASWIAERIAEEAGRIQLP
jgi:cholesterol oxidase